MGIWDYLVLFLYFLVMVAIGVYSARKVKAQEDFFMGGRSFGKLLQTFAAFGAGTGSSDPVNTGRTTFTSGMSGMWSVMYWLFVTPFYWIAGVWYRRMRHLTLGDWFVERYESRALGVAYCFFGLAFYMLYGSMLFSAIGKVAAPLMQIDEVTLFGQSYGIEYVLVPVIGVIVLVYGILGGLHAAYFTDLVQGLCIILLSVILIPYGLHALVVEFGNPETDSMMAGFRYMHEQLPEEKFAIVGASTNSEFPIERILAVVVINLIGVVVQPHFIATGGGSAKTENNARVGLVVGNFLKRFCTVGWVLTSLIALALFANNPELVVDPDKTWGVASRELLGPGLTGLMLACLLAALMSSVDAYMIVGSGLAVRNFFAPYFNPDGTEQQYLLVARLTGVMIVGGAVVVSLFLMDVFQQLQLTWVFNVLFAAPFWVGLFWRRATRTAAWVTVVFNLLFFFVVPFVAPRMMPQLRESPAYLTTNQVIRTTVTRTAAPNDVKQREAKILHWEQETTRLDPLLESAENEYRRLLAEAESSEDEQQQPSETYLKNLSLAADDYRTLRTERQQLGDKPEPLEVGGSMTEVKVRGGKGIFWPGGVRPIDADGNPLDLKPQPTGEPIVDKDNENTEEVLLAYPEGTRFKGYGNFQLDYLLFQLVGIDLSRLADSTLDALNLVPKIIVPFVVMIVVSLITRPNNKEALDRYYIKMKTPVDPDPEADQAQLEEAYANPELAEQKKLFPGTSLEFQKPTVADIVGFIVCFATCFGIIALAWWVTQLGK